MSQYNFTKSVALDRLEKEIRDSSIKIALDHSTLLGTSLSIYFKDTLDATDETTLNNLVTNHVATPLPQPIQTFEITKQPDPAPFATPSYRTKRMKTENIETVTPNQNKEVLFVLASELFTHGGCLVVQNAQLGDWISAEVKDKDSIIPVQYRAALCEAWPVVGEYIPGEWVEVQGEYSVHTIDTSPLIAKITQGLYLSFHYHAINSGVDRKIGINYYMNKKL